MKIRRTGAFLLAVALLITALSGCKKQDNAEGNTAAAQVESGKTVQDENYAQTSSIAAGTSLPQAAGANTETRTDILAGETEKTDPEPATEPQKEGTLPEGSGPSILRKKTDDSKPDIRARAGIKESYGSIRLPDGVPFKMICENGALKEGMEKYYQNSFCETYTIQKGTVPSGTEEYAYSFSGAVISNLDWCREKDQTALYYLDESDALYAEYMEQLGEDGLIVIGKTTGKREGHLAYTDMRNSIATYGFTLTDFAVDEVLYGEHNKKTVRIKEDYSFGKYLGNKEQLIAGGILKFALPDNQRFLLLLKKCAGQNCYTVIGNGGFPLTDDYKKYDQEYLDHLAGYLNLIPEEWDRDMAEALTRKESSFYEMHAIADQTDRDPKEALEANKDDLIVALAQKYRIRIWPYRSRAYEDAGLAWNYFYYKACVPDYKNLR